MRCYTLVRRTLGMVVAQRNPKILIFRFGPKSDFDENREFSAKVSSHNFEDPFFQIWSEIKMEKA